MISVKVFRGVVFAALTALGCASYAQEDEESTRLVDRLKERVYWSGTLEIESAIETSTGNGQKFEAQLQPEFEIALPKDVDLTIIPRFRFDLLDRLVPGQPDQDEIGPLSRSGYFGEGGQAELREMYIEAVAGDTYLTIGKQQVVWGKADGLKVLDVVNPQDFREFVLDDYDDSRIPLWTVNAEIPIKNATLQLLWIPDQTYHKIPEDGAAFEFVSNVPQSPPRATTVTNDFNRPSSVIKDSDFGARLSAFWKGWDVSLNYLYHYDDVPVLFRTISGGGPLTVTVNPGYERTHLMGATFSNAFGDLTLRGEIGFSLDKFFSTTDVTDVDGVHETDELGYVLGFDWFGISETLLSFQLFQSRLMDDAPGLLRDQTVTNLSFLAQRDFINDTLVISNIIVHNVNDGDGFVRPKVEYDIRDNLELWAGFDLFYGSANGLFGQYENRNRLLLGMEWGF